jgi:hypothetical protein
MKKKTARRIINKNKWKAASIRLTGEGQRSKSEKYLLKQIDKAKEILIKEK